MKTLAIHAYDSIGLLVVCAGVIAIVLLFGAAAIAVANLDRNPPATTALPTKKPKPAKNKTT